MFMYVLQSYFWNKNKGVYWNRGAYWNEDAYSLGALIIINKNRFKEGTY